MNDTILGVIIGGIIASIGPIITLIENRSRWNKEIKLQHLRAKRDKLEKAYSETLQKIMQGMLANSFSSDMMSDIDYIFPLEVSKAFEAMMTDHESDEAKRKHYYFICQAMKSSLAKIDTEIEEIIK